ncbi:uncharacterized protein G2W53_002439 [Senna tora]|uniref:Uncharacterized protein n=1 Tax=Senna tora TaxID=362788 RepID=A0A835CKC5_9FABA|nr:uncharacterized protein G2W53_002439 [Senna tora]
MGKNLVGHWKEEIIFSLRKARITV